VGLFHLGAVCSVWGLNAEASGPLFRGALWRPNDRTQIPRVGGGVSVVRNTFSNLGVGAWVLVTIYLTARKHQLKRFLQLLKRATAGN
jgi:hypothetical protein